MKIFSVFIFTLITLNCADNSYALSVKTHFEVNEYTFNNTTSLIDIRLKGFNLSDGINTVINGKDVRKHIADGGKTEDNFPRYATHYHNPLKPWNQSGYGYGFFASTPNWAQNINVFPQNVYSWPSAREYLYQALTATDEDSRNSNFANCFRSIGQVMHLLQDMSVPAHVRDDSHAIGNIYEIWVNNELKNMHPGPFEDTYLKAYTYNPDPYLFRTWYNSSAQIPIAGLFDSDIYDGIWRIKSF